VHQIYPENPLSWWQTSSGFLAASNELVRPRRTSSWISLDTCQRSTRFYG